jgi:hypothetical protein
LRNEPNALQVARVTQRLLKIEVESRNHDNWALDNLDGFEERTLREAKLREKVEPGK